MGEYNKVQFNFADNVSVDYSYTVTCVIGDENVTDSASFRLRTDGSADMKLEGSANTFATAIFVLMCLAILVGLAALATMGLSDKMVLVTLVEICIAVIVLIVVVGSLLG
jgi:hypothetical protein